MSVSIVVLLWQIILVCVKFILWYNMKSNFSFLYKKEERAVHSSLKGYYHYALWGMKRYEKK